MKQLTIISGKGGTGKTTITAAFAALSDSRVIADCDVDAADLHLILNPALEKREEFYGGRTAVIDSDKCQQCDECSRVCRFDAIKDYTVDPIACEGCGVCVHACPEGAITMERHMSGHWFISQTRCGPMTHAKLGIAEENSGKLVTLVRQEAKKIAEEKGLELVLTDGPPGVGCPVIAALGGARAVIIVTEPTVTGKHDMERVVHLADHFNVPVMVCINKYDLNIDVANDIKKYSQRSALTFLGNIPFDPIFIQSMVRAQTIFEYDKDSKAAEAVKDWPSLNSNIASKIAISYLLS